MKIFMGVDRSSMIKKTLVSATLTATSCMVVLLAFSSCSSQKEYSIKRIIKTQPKKGNRIEAEKLQSRALAFHKRKNYFDAERTWIKAVDADPSWDKMYYNLACIYAIKNDSKTSVELLEKGLSINKSRVLYLSAQNDSDFKSIKNSRHFIQLMHRLWYYKLLGIKHCITDKTYNSGIYGSLNETRPYKCQDDDFKCNLVLSPNGTVDADGEFWLGGVGSYFQMTNGVWEIDKENKLNIKIRLIMPKKFTNSDEDNFDAFVAKNHEWFTTTSKSIEDFYKLYFVCDM